MRHRLVAALASLLCTFALQAGDPAYRGTIDQLRLYDSPWFETLTGTPAIGIEQPVVVAASGNEVFFADDFHQEFYLYNQASDSTRMIAGLYRQLGGKPTVLYLDNHQDLYVADSFAREVLRFDQQGKLLLRYADPLHLNAPAGMCINPRNQHLFVLDGLYGHLVEFGVGGTAVALHGLRGNGEHLRGSRRLVGMGCDAQRIYTVSALTPQILVFDYQGELLKQIPAPELRHPGALALDGYGRIYVSDRFDDTIRIYREEGLIGAFGGTGSGPLAFREIRALWVDGMTLYVADSGNRRIQLFSLSRPEQP